LFTFWTQCYSCKIWLDKYYTEFFNTLLVCYACKWIDWRFNSRKFERFEILITFQWSGLDHWNVGLRRTYVQNGLYSIFTGKLHEAFLFWLCNSLGIFLIRFANLKNSLQIPWGNLQCSYRLAVAIFQCKQTSF
jgi:hypothetical protein